MYCTKCGKKLEDNANFCTACGAKKQVLSPLTTSNHEKHHVSNSNAQSAAVTYDFTCVACNNHNESGKKKTSHGTICADCLQHLKDLGLSHRVAKNFTQDQFFALCNNNISRIERIKPFVLDNAPISLKKDEHCYYSANARGGKIKTVTTHYTGGNNGYSVRLMKNFSYHSSNSSRQAVRGQVLDLSQYGTFIITNQRCILLTTTFGFELQWSKIVNIELHTDGLALHTGSKAHIVITDDIDQVTLIIKLLIEATKEHEQQLESEQIADETSKIPKRSRTSPADEIRKYKKLADDGIITNEEFEKKKKELLNS